MRRLRVWPVLLGVRGEPAADLAVFADAAVALGQLMLTSLEILSVDINPMIVGSNRGANASGAPGTTAHGGLAVDAVVVQQTAA
jgi:ATP-grasp domain